MRASSWLETVDGWSVCRRSCALLPRVGGLLWPRDGVAVKPVGGLRRS